jgi:hypothetical protein
MTRSSDGIELTLFSKPQLLITESAADFAALNAALMEEIKPRAGRYPRCHNASTPRPQCQLRSLNAQPKPYAGRYRNWLS